MTDSTKLRQLIAQTMLLCDESAAFQRDATLAAALTEARQTLGSLHKRVQSAETRYSVGVVGLTNVGKSTLLNALFGRELAPRRNGPCTAAPIEFVYGDALAVAVHYFNSVQRPTWNCASVEDVHARLSALADSAGAEQSRLIRKVIVTAPLDLLANGLIVCDTPGFGAAQLGDAAGSHDEAVMRYLKTDLSQVFWVVLGEQGIGKREKDFHASFFGEICDDIIVTGCEDWEDRDKSRFQKRFSSLFCQRMPYFHFVSGLLGHKARLNNDAAQLEEAGIPDLESRIKSLANPEGRNQSIIASYQQLGRDVMNWFSDYLQEGHEAMLWRSDSFARFQSFVAAIDGGELAGQFCAGKNSPIRRASGNTAKVAAWGDEPKEPSQENPVSEASLPPNAPEIVDVRPFATAEPSPQKRSRSIYSANKRKEGSAVAWRTLSRGVAAVVIMTFAFSLLPSAARAETLMSLYFLSLTVIGAVTGWRVECILRRWEFLLLRTIFAFFGFIALLFLLGLSSSGFIFGVLLCMIIFSFFFGGGVILSAIVGKLQKRKTGGSHG